MATEGFKLTKNKLKVKNPIKKLKIEKFWSKTCHPNHRFEIRANMAAFRAKPIQYGGRTSWGQGRHDGARPVACRRRPCEVVCLSILIHHIIQLFKTFYTFIVLIKVFLLCLYNFLVQILNIIADVCI